MLLVIAVMASFVLASTAQAAQHDTEGRRVIPMGRTVGIKLFSDGVMVVGFSEVSAAGGSSAPAVNAVCGRGTSSRISTARKWTPSKRSKAFCSRSAVKK